MTEGLLPQSTMEKRMEDIGEECLEELVLKTFFHHVPYYYLMHNLIQELAQCVAGEFCYNLDDSNIKSIKRVVCVIYHINNGLESKICFAITDLLSKPKRLHVFYLNYFNLKFCFVVCHVALNNWGT